MIRTVTGFCLLLGSASAQTAPDLLAQIREKMAFNLSQVPNYTCTQTIERSERRSVKQKFQPLDRIRLEIALVGGKELLSWPGAGKFEERDLGDFVSGGTTATGDYAIHAQTVFRSQRPTFRMVGEEQLDGRQAIRFDYDVALAKSEFLVRTGDREAKVPYHGSFWADRDTLELMRLDVIADKIPTELGMARGATQIRYKNARVGASDFLLPQSVELSLQTLDGAEHHNRTAFANCRQYVGESVIRFDIPEPGAEVVAGPVQEIELPAGLELAIQLTGAVNFKTAMVGDPLDARLSTAVKRGGRVLVPKGAVIHGRIRQMLNRGDFVLAGIEMFEAEFDNKKAPLLCRLEGVGMIPGAPSRTLMLLQQDSSGVGVLMMQTVRISSLPSGFRMHWVTLPKSK